MATSARLVRKKASLSAANPLPVGLITDFQPGEVFVGILHGVIAKKSPQTRVLDLCHCVAPGNIVGGALALEAVLDHVPEPCVFCCVVDPGVGSERRALAATDGRHFFVAPDNGLLDFACQRAGEALRRWETRVVDLDAFPFEGSLSATFHGRDLFAPAAALISLGGVAALRGLGPLAPEDAPPVRLEGTGVSFASSPGHWTLSCRALASDSFGNVITSLRRDDWERLWSGRGAIPPPKLHDIEIHVGKKKWLGLVLTFADVESGAPLAYWGSGGRLEIGIRDGNAARLLKIEPGMEIRLSARSRARGLSIHGW